MYILPLNDHQGVNSVHHSDSLGANKDDVLSQSRQEVSQRFFTTKGLQFKTA